jgi:hypothetical protein
MPTIPKRRQAKAKHKSEARPVAKNLRPAYAPRMIYERTVRTRAVIALEAFASAIDQLESCDRDDLGPHLDELVAVRRRTWGERPWAGAANDPDKARQHLLDMFDGFVAEVGAPGYAGEARRYRNRVHPPAETATS